MCRIVVVAALISASVNVAWAEISERPNFVIVNVDDLGFGDIGPFGNTTQPTPNLDRMAERGRKLTSHYGAPVCTPSRASLMTGCYPKRALPIAHVLFPSSRAGLHPQEVTIAEILKQQGYATKCIGKWHLGDQPKFLPTRQGFDSYFGLPYSNDMGPPEDGAKSNFGKPLPSPRPANNANATVPLDGIRGNAQPPLPLLEGEEVVERVTGQQQLTLTRRYTEKAIQFIETHRHEPFFLYLPHSAVHFPLYPSQPFRGRSQNGLFGDWVTEVDWSVGQILDRLEELELSSQTLVIFTSDNGGATRHGANNGPLRGAKGSTWEGGIRVPTICMWTGKIPAGSSTDSMTTMMDILPTLAGLAGANLPTDRKIDGVNIWPILSAADDSTAPPREQFLYFRGLKLEAIRMGDWKFHRKNNELYNLRQDIAESVDVAEDHPNVVAKLQAALEQVDADLGLDGIGPGCRSIGTVTEARPLIQSP